MRSPTEECSASDTRGPALGMNGLEVARRARSLPRGRKMLLVALTGWGQDEDRHRSEEAGFDLHLTKPIDAHQLAAILTRPLASADGGIDAREDRGG